MQGGRLVLRQRQHPTSAISSLYAKLCTLQPPVPLLVLWMVLGSRLPKLWIPNPLADPICLLLCRHWRREWGSRRALRRSGRRGVCRSSGTVRRRRRRGVIWGRYLDRLLYGRGFLRLVRRERGRRLDQDRRGRVAEMLLFLRRGTGLLSGALRECRQMFRMS